MQTRILRYCFILKRYENNRSSFLYDFSLKFVNNQIIMISLFDGTHSRKDKNKILLKIFYYFDTKYKCSKRNILFILFAYRSSGRHRCIQF